jgi:hypothetical protein
MAEHDYLKSAIETHSNTVLQSNNKKDMLEAAKIRALIAIAQELRQLNNSCVEKEKGEQK